MLWAIFKVPIFRVTMSNMLQGFQGRLLLPACALIAFAGMATAQTTSCDTSNGGYTLSIEQIATDLGTLATGPETVDLSDYSTYRIFLNCESSEDKLSAVSGDASRPVYLTTTGNFYQSSLFEGANGALANAISPALFSVYPDTEFDSWVTIGIEQAPNSSNGETSVSLVEDPTNPLSVGFANGGNLVIDTPQGSAWFIENSDVYTNGLAGSDSKVLIAQVTTDGEVSGQFGLQVFRNGISDDANCVRPYLGVESHGCLEPTACNYTPNVLFDNGSCDFCSCPDSMQVLSSNFSSDSLPQYSIDIDLIADHDTTGIIALNGMKTYRLYAVVETAGDRVNAVYGNDMAPLAITSTAPFYQAPLGAETPSNISSLLFDFPAYVDLEYDSWATIGIDRSPSFMEGTGYEAVTVAGDWAAPFEAGGGIFASGVVGGTWFALPSSSNVIPDENLRILIGQFTTAGVVSGTLAMQVIPATLPAGIADFRLPFSFTSDGLGDFNYLYPEICTCDNVDGDYLCDNVDDCVGQYDECGICNGPGATGECGCNDIPAGDCDCNGNQLDALGICGGTCASDADGNGTCDDSEVQGCVDSSASNYDVNATQDDGTCFYLGCTDPTASNYDTSANTDDGSCQYPGCTDPDAWNYDDSANVNDGSCQDNACGVIGELVIATNYAFTPSSVSIPTGGTVVWQNNTSSLHNANGVTNSITGAPFDNPEDFSLAATIGNDAGICIGSYTFHIPGVYQYDCSVGIHADLGMVGTIIVGTGGCMDTGASNYSSDTEYDDGSCVFPGCTDPAACNYDSNANSDDSSCLLATGCQTCSGQTDGTGVVVNNDTDGDGVCDADEVPGCQDQAACNYNANATDFDDSCTYLDGICETCENGLIVVNDADDDGVCDANEVTGCTDPMACNYDSDPTTDTDNTLCTYVDGVCETCENGLIVDNDADDDGVCDANEVTGCTDATACNYDSDPTTDTDNALCAYVDGVCETCENGIVVDNDTDNDSVCDADEVTGCTDPTACNYDSDPTTDTDNALCTYVDSDCETCENGIVVDNDQDNDGVCDADEIVGCQDQTACNYNAAATDADDSCIYLDGECETCENGVIVDNDADNDGVCDANEVTGCTDPTACNYDSDPTTDTDNTLCTYTSPGLDCNGECINDADDDGICDENEAPCHDYNNNGVCDAEETYGCTYIDACNYSIQATADDGSCTYAAAGFNCDGSSINGSGDFAGCTYTTALNYSAVATMDDGTCVFPDVPNETGPCLFDVSGDSTVNTPDLLIFLQYWESTCE